MNIINKIILLILIITNSSVIDIGTKRQVDPHQKADDEYEYNIWHQRLKEDKIPNNAIELIVNKKIPIEKEIEEKGIYLKGVWNVSVDKRGHIYVPDSRLCIIYEFGKDGKYISKYDKRGQGPGEIQYPSDILFYKDQIVVMDNSIGKISYFDRNWKYLKSISLINAYKPFGIMENGNIYCQDYSYEKLIAVLDENGNLIKKYGDIIFPSNKKSPLNKTKMALSPEGNVWVGFIAYGIVREYLENGDLLKEIIITDTLNKLKKSYVEINEKFEKKKANALVPIIVRIALKNNNIYVTIGGPVNMIYKINNSGKIENIFYIKPKYLLYNECFYADNDHNNNEEFYLLVSDSDVYIGVYGRK